MSKKNSPAKGRGLNASNFGSRNLCLLAGRKRFNRILSARGFIFTQDQYARYAFFLCFLKLFAQFCRTERNLYAQTARAQFGGKLQRMCREFVMLSVPRLADGFPMDIFR